MCTFSFVFFALIGCTDAPAGKDSASESQPAPTDELDADGDGAYATVDCDDEDPTIYPGASEVCDEVDNDCDGDTDEDAEDASTFYPDADGDGYGVDGEGVTACEAPAGFSSTADDCDDNDPAYNPGADESDCADPNDYNCDGSVGFADADGDGYAACVDCDDNAAGVHEGAAEICDGVDQDCDGETDEDAADGTLWYADADADGYGDTNVTVSACTQPEGHTDAAGDCDDSAAAFNPGASETDCEDPNDYNCDGSAGAEDRDGDGFAACVECDDSDAAINPAAEEVCDGLDNNCDGNTDDGTAGASVWYADADADGYGDVSVTIEACEAPAGYVATGDDCDDTDPAYNPGVVESDCTDPNDYNCDGAAGTTDADADGYIACEDCDDTSADISPGATELCDSVDNNCDGTIDEDSAADAATWYVDADLDGFGLDGSGVTACSLGLGYASLAGDCDDSSATASPAGVEECDGADNNCDGTIDEGVGSEFYADVDGDTFGDAGSPATSCELPAGYVEDASDCDDADGSAFPGGTEVCDGADNNCDGTVDEPEATDAGTWYYDGDGDGYGDAATTELACSAPGGYGGDNTDCDDTIDTTYPGADELCNGADDNCDGETDEDSAIDAPSWYSDVDADGFGDVATGVLSCTAPAGAISDNTDCDDTNDSINPDAAEVCDPDNIDENCNGAADDEDTTVDAESLLTFYADVDFDSYGDPSNTVLGCELPPDYVDNAVDCDDSRDDVNPDAVEVCDALNTDDDCNGTADDDDAAVDSASRFAWYADADGDGFGDLGDTTATCDQPAGYEADSTDCDDTRVDVNPASTEVCDEDNVDEDCSGAADDDDPGVDASTFNIYYSDADADTYGDLGSPIESCELPAGATENADDCNDADDEINPDAVEVCDEGNADEDCNGAADDEDTGVDAASRFRFYADADADDFGDPAVSLDACDQPEGYVAEDERTDCDDADDSINPDAVEVCDALDTDEDCNGAVDDADAAVDSGSYSVFYTDADEDTFGDADSMVMACDAGGSLVADDTDCDDADAAINPDAEEVCDELDTDEDCDGLVDDDDLSVAVDSLDRFPMDFDGDGFGGIDAIQLAGCEVPAGYAEEGGDCDDDDDTVYPDAPEGCGNGGDEGCDDEDDCEWAGTNIVGTEADETYVGIPGYTASTYPPGFFGGAFAGGDVTGDGIDDIVASDRNWDYSSTVQNVGRVYLLAGASGGVTATLALPTATITGASATTDAGDSLGQGLAVLPDFDGDADDELLIGQFKDNGASTDAGRAYLFRGGSTLVGALGQASASVTLAGSTGSTAAASELLGWSVAGIGDVDADGFEDWAAAAPGYGGAGATARSGRISLVPGDLPASVTPYAAAAATLLGTITGTAGEIAGASLLGADVNDDGLTDTLVHAIGVTAAPIYVFDGGVTGTVTTAAADFSLTGAGAVYTIGSSSLDLNCSTCLADGGDVNGDGYSDLWIGADSDDTIAANAGAAFLLHGPISASGTVAAATDFTVRGVLASDFVGRAVAGAGDVDNDGYDDLLVGGSGIDLPVSAGGATALFYGPVSGSASFTASGTVLFPGGQTNSNSGSAVAGLGDVDADGFSDFMIGAPNAIDTAYGATKVGAGYLFYGAGE